MKVRVGFCSGKSDQLLRLNLDRLRKGVASSILTPDRPARYALLRKKIRKKRLGTAVSALETHPPAKARGKGRYASIAQR